MFICSPVHPLDTCNCTDQWGGLPGYTWAAIFMSFSPIFQKPSLRWHYLTPQNPLHIPFFLTLIIYQLLSIGFLTCLLIYIFMLTTLVWSLSRLDRCSSLKAGAPLPGSCLLILYCLCYPLVPVLPSKNKGLFMLFSSLKPFNIFHYL